MLLHPVAVVAVAVAAAAAVGVVVVEDKSREELTRTAVSAPILLSCQTAVSCSLSLWAARVFAEAAPVMPVPDDLSGQSKKIHSLDDGQDSGEGARPTLVCLLDQGMQLHPRLRPPLPLLRGGDGSRRGHHDRRNGRRRSGAVRDGRTSGGSLLWAG